MNWNECKGTSLQRTCSAKNCQLGRYYRNVIQKVALRKILVFIILSLPFLAFSQGVSNIWLLGYSAGVDTNTTSLRATIDFNGGVLNLTPNTRKMKFFETQGNISDSNGNLLMSSNGVWIANSSGDTMMNGSGLNPNSFTSDWSSYGIPLPNGNVFLPYPDDSTKYVLIHMTGNYTSGSSMSASYLYSTIVDITLDNGLGGGVQKNQILLSDTLSWGIGSCKHANGRDWWIIVIKDNSHTLFKLLLTPNGITYFGSQTFLNQISNGGNAFQPVFSNDGNKFSFFNVFPNSGLYADHLNIFDFDRCTGIFSNHVILNSFDNALGFATAFSPNSKYLYAATIQHIYQVHLDSANYHVDTVATYDGFYSPVPPFSTRFWLMYLAADKKIYLTSGNGIIDLGVINYPDSAGLGCDVQQHSIHIPCYHVASVPNHPNYFLGADSSSICDSLTSSIVESIFNSKKILNISPNPASVIISINAMDVKGSKAILKIYNAVGELIGSRRINVYGGFATQDVNVETLPTGIYIVRMEGEKAVYVGKFVKN